MSTLREMIYDETKKEGKKKKEPRLRSRGLKSIIFASFFFFFFGFNRIVSY
jgi:hypothetical protein